METHEQLLARIERLELAHQHSLRVGRNALRFGALAALTAIGGFSLSMRTTCNTVSAERFVLLDAQGHQRALLTAYDTGGVPELALYDKKGRAAATLGVEKSGAYLTLADATLEKSVRYGVGCDAAPTTPGAPGASGASGAKSSAPDEKPGNSALEIVER